MRIKEDIESGIAKAWVRSRLREKPEPTLTSPIIGHVFGEPFGPHRPWWKAAINTPLRLMQLPFTDRPWVIYSIFDISCRPPALIGYGFGRIRHAHK